VVHTRGQILEETHYYPFGLTMAGISSKAAGKMQNKDKTFQSQKFDDDLGLNWVQFKWRNHDPQIGRFIEIDPLSEKYVYNSTYAFSENKVVRHVELEGLESWDFMSTLKNVAGFEYTTTKSFVNNMTEVAKDPNTYKNAALGMGSFLGATLLGIATGGIGDGTYLSTSINSGVRTEVATTEVSLATRAEQIQGTLSSATQSRTTTAVASATTSEGNATTLVASSEKNLRPAQIAALKPGEIAVSGAGHAEATILNYANANNMTVNSVAASRPICAGCATAINNAGATPASPLKVFATPPPLSKEVIKILHQ
jgi:RHS repeat-associated protein